MAYIDSVSDVTLATKNYDKFPVILNSEHVVYRLPLKYFVSNRRLWCETTLVTYSKYLCEFYSQLEVENSEATFDHINDDWLEAYAFQILNRNQNKPTYVSQLLNFIVHFLLWCEENSYCKNLIGTNKSFKIKVIKTRKSSTHQLVQAYEKQKSAPKNAPKISWIEKILEEENFKSEDLLTRFSLMIDWGKEAGLRAKEIVELCIDQIPSREDIEKSIISKEMIYIKLTATKGKVENNIPISSILLKRTRDYIDFERVKLIKKLQSKSELSGEKYDEPIEIFLSSRSGKKLHKRTLSNQVRKAWVSALKNEQLGKNQYVWLHGLRHYFATKKLVDVDEIKSVRNPEEFTKTLTRHKHSSTLNIYTNRIILDDMYG